MDQKVPKESQKLAGRIFDSSDYHKKNQVSAGLAQTHEQFSDVYMKGEIGTAIDHVNETKISKKNGTKN